MPVRREDVTAYQLPDGINRKADPDRANFIALARKGWDVSLSRIAGYQATKHSAGQTVYAFTLRALLNKAAKKDAERKKP